MLEIPLQTIRGIEDDTMTMLEIQNLFKAIKEGKIRRVSWVDAKGKYEAYEIRVVTLCKDCRFGGECDSYMGRKAYVCDKTGIVHDELWFCAEGKPKDGESI